jgi:hypothetical protein
VKMSSSYQKFSGICGILAGAAGLLYLALFVMLKNPAALLPALCLLAVGVLSSAVIVALYQRLRGEDEGFALWGLLLGVGGAGGAAIHAAFDLSNNLHSPAAPFGYANPVDPRGFLTFAVTGLAAVVLSWLILRSKAFPSSAGYLGVLSGVLLILLYITYLTILNPLNPLVLFLVLFSGFIQPVWYIWIGWLLYQAEARLPHRAASVKGQ